MRPFRVTKLVSGFLLLAAIVQNLAGQTQNQAAIDLRQASLEDLMDIMVTSVSKRTETFADRGGDLRHHPGGYPQIRCNQTFQIFCEWLRVHHDTRLIWIRFPA